MKVSRKRKHEKESTSIRKEIKKGLRSSSSSSASSSSSSSSSDSESSSSSSTTSYSSDSSDTSSSSNGKRTKKINRKHNKSKQSVKGCKRVTQKKQKQKHVEKKKKSKRVKKAKPVSEAEDDGCTDVPLNLMAPSKSMAPMTKEQWEKQQSVVRKVYDESTGRQRLIKGDGEVIEEIVSKERHQQINQQATKGDGNYFEKKLALNKPR